MNLTQKEEQEWNLHTIETLLNSLSDAQLIKVQNEIEDILETRYKKEF
jgi:hypothetical protein